MTQALRFGDVSPTVDEGASFFDFFSFFWFRSLAFLFSFFLITKTTTTTTTTNQTKCVPGDPCWSGRALTDTAIGGVVTCLIKAGRLPYSSNSVTLVLTGPDVSQGSDATGSFCTSLCGFHSYSVRQTMF